MNLSIHKIVGYLLQSGVLVFISLVDLAVAADELPIIDAHIHYSHDAWAQTPPEAAVAILREAGLRKAFVSSSSDEGTQKLFAIAPELVVPVLRPYRKRGDDSSWMYDRSIISMLSERLSKYHYAGIGEFHASGDEIDLPVLQKVIELAKQYSIYLHADVDSEAIHRIFTTNPEALVLWAHSGYGDPGEIRTLLEKYPGLWSDLATRNDHLLQGQVAPEWRELFLDFPDRFLLGSDTYTPDRWYFVIEHAEGSRAWLNSLPPSVAKKIAYRNAEALLTKAGY